MTEQQVKDRREIVRLLKKGQETLADHRAEKVVDFVRYRRIKHGMVRLEKKLVSERNDIA